MESEHKQPHSSGHDHAHTHDYVSANREYYDKEAHKYDARQDVAAVTKNIVIAMRETYPDLFDKDSTTVLDYACGTGMVSRELIPYAKSIVGVDISGGAVEVYNTRASELGLAPEEMNAVCAELKGNEDELDGAKFNVIVCSMSYHHFGSIDAVTQTLAFFLKPGGSLLVSDRTPGSKSEQDAAEDVPENVRHAVAHLHGFDEEAMRRVFEGTGLEQFQYKDSGAVGSGVLGNGVKIFLARGIKPL
ncbi:S-adenosyl-L-methionine-dependent methyltransferase [Obba rivulosa]|uniref:S-adenosyl-L-methionine-dependent methyltransferase n=1 Tax=Obba rivulosa TaxID=1052685 RepID=A0A8E2DS30_9APHY|nr:S-adenosyl-L-methionine-dependent methyltransferase [Obba rivulosa]